MGEMRAISVPSGKRAAAVAKPCVEAAMSGVACSAGLKDVLLVRQGVSRLALHLVNLRLDKRDATNALARWEAAPDAADWVLLFWNIYDGMMIW